MARLPVTIDPTVPPDANGYRWDSANQEWVDPAHANAAYVAPTASYTPPAARPVVGGFAQEVPSTMGTRTPNGGRAGVTGGGTPTTGTGTSGGGTGTATTQATPGLTNSPRSAGTPPRTIEEWYGDKYVEVQTKILMGWAQPSDYPNVPANLFGIKNPASPNYNAQFQVQTGMLDGYIQPIIQQQYAASGLNLPSVPQQDPNVIGANTSAANNAATNTANTTNTNATIAGNKAIAEGNNATTIAAQKLQNEGALAVANVKAGTDMASIQAQKDIAAGDRTSRETIAANALAESGRQFDITTAEGARQFNANTLVSLLDKGIQLAQKPVDWIGYQYFMNNMGIPMNALTANAAVNMFGAVPPSGPSAAGPVTGGPGVVYGDTSHAEAMGVTPQFVSVTQAISQNPGQSADPAIAQNTSAALLPQWQQQAGGANQLESTLAQARQSEVAPSLRPDNPARAALLQQMAATPAQPLAQPGLPALPATPSNGGFGTSMTAPGVAAPSSWSPPPATPSMPISPFGQPVGDQLTKGMGSTPVVTGAVTNSMGAPNTAAVMAPPTPLGQPNTTMPEPASYIPPHPMTAPSTASAPESAPGQQVNVTTGGNTGGATGIYTGTPTPAVANTATGTSTTTSTSGANTPQGSDLLRHLSTQLGIPYDQLAALVPPGLMAGGYSPEQIAQTPVIQGLQNPDGPGFGGQFRTAPVGDSKFGTIQAFGIPLNLRGGQDISAQSFMNTTAANRDMIQGAVEATGQNWADVQNQMLRSSPVSNYQGGAFGRRVY